MSTKRGLEEGAAAAGTPYKRQHLEEGHEQTDLGRLLNLVEALNVESLRRSAILTDGAVAQMDSDTLQKNHTKLSQLAELVSQATKERLEQERNEATAEESENNRNVDMNTSAEERTVTEDDLNASKALLGLQVSTAPPTKPTRSTASSRAPTRSTAPSREPTRSEVLQRLHLQRPKHDCPGQEEPTLAEMEEIMFWYGPEDSLFHALPLNNMEEHHYKAEVFRWMNPSFRDRFVWSFGQWIPRLGQHEERNRRYRQRQRSLALYKENRDTSEPMSLPNNLVKGVLPNGKAKLFLFDDSNCETPCFWL